MFILGGGLTVAAGYVADISLWPERFFPLRVLMGAVTFALFGFGVFFNASAVRRQDALLACSVCWQRSALLARSRPPNAACSNPSLRTCSWRLRCRFCSLCSRC